MSYSSNRRDFLKSALVGGFTVWIGGRAYSQGNKSPNDRIDFACIGVGGKGDSDSSDAASHGNVIAICDVDSNTLDRAAKKWPDAKKYSDYRKMYDELGHKINGVTVSIPDHSHYAATALALHRKIACYTQKPLAHSIYEVRKLSELARKNNVATQMGNQGTADNGLRKNAYAVKAGALGKVSEVHVWTDRPIWPQGIDRGQPLDVPSNLAWDLWLGPAKTRPYSVNYHDFKWRGWWDFGTGALGDMGCHNINQAFMALDLRDPTSVQAETSTHNSDSYPKSSHVTYEFPANKERGPVTLHWYDGGRKPSLDHFAGPDFADLLESGQPATNGWLIIGDKGKLYSTGSGGHIIGGVDLGDVKYPVSPGHWEEFVAAIKGGDQAMSNFPNYAGGLAETVLLGNLAVWPAEGGTGPLIKWDARRMKATGGPDMSHIIKPQYRAGYHLD